MVRSWSPVSVGLSMVPAAPSVVRCVAYSTSLAGIAATGRIWSTRPVASDTHDQTAWPRRRRGWCGLVGHVLCSFRTAHPRGDRGHRQDTVDDLPRGVSCATPMPLARRARLLHRPAAHAHTARSACAMARRTSAALKGLVSRGTPLSSKKARVSGLRVSPVRKMKRWHSCDACCASAR